MTTTPLMAVTLGNGTLTVGDFNLSIPATTFDGVISGTGNLVKSGFAQQTLIGANTFTGGMTILNGPLAVSDVADSGLNSPLGAGTSIIFGAANGVGTLLFTGASDIPPIVRSSSASRAAASMLPTPQRR
jgi:autotransporter-associated beta strand protein